MLTGKMRLENTLVTTIPVTCNVAGISVNTTELHTLSYLIQQNVRDSPLQSTNVIRPLSVARVWRRMMFRRTKAVRLLEETPIRWQFWQVVLEKLKQIARRMEV